MAQLAGHDMLKARKIDLIAASAPLHFVEDSPTARLVRQVLGAVAEFEKAAMVAKLRGARDRKRKATGQKVEGRKSLVETRPEAVAMARRLRRRRGKQPALSLRAIAAALAEAGHINERGKPYNSKKSVLAIGAEGLGRLLGNG